MGFYQDIGPMALGSRLRRLSERLYESARATYELYGTPMDPKWFPVFRVLSERGEASTQEIADYVNHSHASISQIVRAMVEQEFVSTEKSLEDARKNVLKLTLKGHLAAANVKPQYEDVHTAAVSLLEEVPEDLWAAIGHLEEALDRQDLYSRIGELHQLRDLAPVMLDDFRPELASEFRRINLEWIEQFFEPEATDLAYLNHPQEKIIDPGGAIVFAHLGDQTVGTCALIPMGDGVFELAKMGVRPAAQGKSIGWLLGLACIEKARDLGAKKLYLESNRSLEPAINLYRKLGFAEVERRESPYSRADIYMELVL